MSKKPHVIQVSAYYPPHTGGQEIAVAGLAIHLAEEGVDVEVITSDLGGKAGKTVENDVPVNRLRSNEFAHTAIIWGLLSSLLKNTKKKSLVHLHVGQAFTPEVVWLASKIKGFKYVIHMHIEPVQSSSTGIFLPLYKRLLLGRAIRGAAAVIVLNQEHKEIIEKQYGYTGKILIMSNCVDDSFFSVGSKSVLSHDATMRLLFVGRLSPQKNLKALLEAVELTKQKVQLDIVGDGECRPELEKIIKDKKLTNVNMAGMVDRKSVLSFYEKCDAFILPSMYEAQGIVLLEAMAASRPIIATDVIGIRETARNVALFVEPTAKGIAKGIERLREIKTDDRRKMIQNGLKKANLARWSNLTKLYIKLYEDLT